jgi:hypothetical protein
MQRRGLEALVFAGLLALPQQADAQAGRSTYHIILREYFSEFYAFPIIAPQGEQPGDVYARPGTLYARKVDCFKEAKIDSKETYLPRRMTLSSSDVAGEAGADQRLIGEALMGVGTKLSNQVSVSYGEDGKATLNQIAERDLISMLEAKNNNSCRDKLVGMLRSATNIPWIIQSTWYATVNLSYQTTSALDANAKATVDKKLLEAKGAVKTDQRSDSLLIVDSGKTAFPVAWRPAFISFDHYQYIDQLMEQSKLRYYLSKIGFAKSDQEILEILQSDFKFDLKKVPPPKDIVERMTTGKPIGFNADNERHREYIRSVNALYGVSQAIYGDSDSR